MTDTHNPNESIKRNSDYLRGTLKNSIADTMTGALAPNDAQLCKFHGFYEQDDRDVRAQRQQQMLEPYYSFMLRARLPGGVCTTQQWLAIDATTRELGNGSIRLTTRQTFQYHGILKHKLKHSPLLKKELSKNLDNRYQSAYEFGTELKGYLQTYATSETAQHALEDMVVEVARIG